MQSANEALIWRFHQQSLTETGTGCNWPFVQFFSVQFSHLSVDQSELRTEAPRHREGHGGQHSASLFLGFISSSSAHLKNPGGMVVMTILSTEGSAFQMCS